MTRREALIVAGGALAAAGLDAGADAAAAQKAVTKGRLKQSASRWCYGKIPMPEFCKAVADMGLTAIDLLEEPEWGVVRDHGLICSMGYAGGGSIRDGLHVKANHDAIVKNFEENIPKAAAMKVPNVIMFFGNRGGMSDAEATANCIEADLIRTFRVNKDHIAHFHTGGVPGRHELDQTQKVDWRGIRRPRITCACSSCPTC